MNHPTFQWVDTAFGGPQKRNNILSLTQLKGHMPDHPTDCYATWHRFPDAYADHIKTTGRVRGYQGPSYADFLLFEFDNEGDLAGVLAQVKNFLRVLEITYEVDGLHGVRCYFSGHKGFHVLVSSALFGGWDPSPDLPRQLKEMALAMTQDHPMADPAVYDQNRLLRLSNTKHSKSGRWKIPLENHELLTSSIDQITELAAKGPRQIEFPPWEDAQVAPPCAEKWQALLKTQPQKSAPKEHANLFPIGLKEGDGRDNQAFLIARHFRDKRLSRNETLDILNLWDAQLEDPLGEPVLEQKIDSAFSRATDADVEEITPDHIKTPPDLFEAYQAYIEKLKSGKVTLGWPQVDARLRGIAPGEVLTLMAKSGVGKTAALQNILRHIALSQDATTLFCSLEQPAAQVLERYAQMATERAGEQIEKDWDNADQRDLIEASVLKDLTHDRTLTCSLSGLKLHQLDQALDAAQTKVGRPPNVLAIDYLGLLDTTDLDKNLYGQISRAARELKNLAKRRDIAVICLCQVSRANGEDGSKPLNIYSARESGAIEESADFLLGLYRPDLQGEDQTITVQILKNRKGQHGIEFSYNFDKKSLRVIQPKLEVLQHEF